MEDTSGDWIFNKKSDRVETENTEMLRSNHVEEAEANAKLIAASPKMLDALKMVYSFMVIDPNYQGSQLLKTVSAAINEATPAEESIMHPIFADALKAFGIK